MANQERIDIIIGAKDQASKILSNLKNSIIGIGVAYLSWQGAKKLLEGTIGAAIESEKVYDALSDAVERHGGEWKKVESRIRFFADELRRTIGVSDEVVAQGLQKLIDAGMNTAKAMDAMRLATDVAAGAHIDLNSAIDLVAKASVGITRGLTQVNIKLDESGTAAEKADAAFKALNEKFGGAAADAMDTSASKLNLFVGALKELGETLGGIATKQNKQMSFWQGLVVTFTNDINVLNALLQGTITFGEALKSIGTRYDSLGNQIENTMLQRLLWLKNQRDIIIAFDSEAEGMQDTTNASNKLTKAIETSRQKLSEYITGWQTIDDKLVEVKETFLDLSNQITESTEPEYQHWRIVEEGVNLYQGQIESATAATQEWADETIYDLTLVEGEWRMVARVAKVSFKSQIDISAAAGNAMSGAMGNAANRIVGSLKFLQTESNGIFKNMAADFMKYFIEEVLRMVAKVLVVKLLKLLAGIFDTRANDMMAVQQGRDFAKYFTQGVLGGITDANLGRNMAMAVGSSGTGRSSFSPAMSRGFNTINLNFYSPITSREFVRNEIVPEIERAVGYRQSNIVIAQSNLTGKAVVAF